MIQHLFLSPHFDDAIGSCGGTISRLVDGGSAVRILTVFGGDEREPFSVPAQVLHDEWKLDRPIASRRLEDASACRILGCENAFLDFTDAIYRQDAGGRHLYPTFDSLRGSIAPEDGALAGRIAAEVSLQLSGKPTFVYCPLAIGGHVDHVVVRNCGRLLGTEGATVLSYRDFYYDREAAADAGVSPMNCMVVSLTPAEISRKVDAFSEYKSQISDLFATRVAMEVYFATTGKTEALFVSRDIQFPVCLRSM